MAVVKNAAVVDARMIGPDTRLLELEAEEPLGFTGGQYIIVDSGRVLPSGKAAKRAYSFLTPDAEQKRFQLAVKRIPDGIVSGYMHELEPGTPVRFSGPWGKFRSTSEVSGRTLVLASDTGVTAALGLLQSEGFKALLPATRFVWLRHNSGYFIPDEFVRAAVPADCGEVRVDVLPPVNHPERVVHARALLRSLLSQDAVDQAFLSGDGRIHYGLLDDLATASVRVGREQLETFFNNPEKKTG